MWLFPLSTSPDRFAELESRMSATVENLIIETIVNNIRKFKFEKKASAWNVERWNRKH